MQKLTYQNLQGWEEVGWIWYTVANEQAPGLQQGACRGPEFRACATEVGQCHRIHSSQAFSRGGEKEFLRED